MTKRQLWQSIACLRALPAGLGLWLAAAVPAAAQDRMSARELADRIVSDNPPFIVDLRSSHQYEAGHIPGAVNIPLKAVASRRLPPVGEVILYTDGLGKLDPSGAAVELAGREGLQPVLLRGGYAAWQTVSGVTTEQPGFRKAQQSHISYDELVESAGSGAVIYDLRVDGQSDLQARFPQARIVEGDPRERLRATAAAEPQSAKVEGEGTARNPLLRASADEAQELVVLIDDDNRSAAKAARDLRAGGLHRVVVLAGGDRMVQMEGRSGLERRSSGSFLWDQSEEDKTGSASEGEDQP